MPAAPAPAPNRWAAAAALDPQTELGRFTQQRKGGGGFGGGDDEAGRKKAPAAPAPLSVMQRKLAQTNTKGMKPMSAFFAAAPPKAPQS